LGAGATPWDCRLMG